MSKLKLALCATAFIVSGAAHAAEVSGDAVKIGVLTDMSGPLSSMAGPGSVAAAEMAIEDFGGEVLGKPVELLTADHQNKPDIASAVARRWIDQQGVDMLSDMVSSSVALAVQRLATSKDTMMITTSAATSALTNEECSPLAIHYVYDTYSLAAGTAKAVLANGGKKWFFLTVDYAYGHSLEENTTSVINELGGTVVGAVHHPLGTSDMTSYLLQAQATDADVIALANSGTDFINAISQAAEFGVGRDKQMVGMLVFLENAHSVGLKAIQGLQFTLAWYWDQSDEAREFAERFQKRQGKMPNSLNAGLYSAVTNYLRAVEAAGTDDATAVREQFAKMKMTDMFHKNAWVREDGRVMHDMKLMEAKKPSESNGEWDLFKVARTIPADEAFMPLSQSECSMVQASAKANAD
ncbi:ABC transporter substrate-binding protein [Ectothiorhodospiraceae bacterium WFHF3C12]|nr:ABC transporter substrate-binding protein [Ectothiorhodospiraceae bacterium WFHF3C12]